MAVSAKQPQAGIDPVASTREEPVAVRPTTEGGEANGEERPASVPTNVETLAMIDVSTTIEMLTVMDVPAALGAPATADMSVIPIGGKLEL